MTQAQHAYSETRHDWTMEKEGTQTVPIVYSDVLAITAAGDYLPPQLLYQGKTPKPISFPEGWDVALNGFRKSGILDANKFYISIIILVLTIPSIVHM